MGAGGRIVADLIVGSALGAYPNIRRISALGNNPDVDAAEDIWTGGGAYPWMTAATSLEILSASENDTAAGTGARTVVIAGLDINYAEITVTVTLNGITPVALSSQLFRINGAVVATCGTGNTNAGDITIRDAGGGTTRAVLQAGYSISRQSQFTVPAGYKAIVNTYILSINRPTTARDATLSTYIKPFGQAARKTVELSIDGNPVQLVAPVLTELFEKTDFGISCNYVSAANSDVTAAWAGIMAPVSDLNFL